MLEKTVTQWICHECWWLHWSKNIPLSQRYLVSKPYHRPKSTSFFTSDLEVTLIFQCYPHTSLPVLLSHDPQALLLQHQAPHTMQTTPFSDRIGATQNHHTSWNGSCLFRNLPVLRRWKAIGWEGTRGTDLYRAYPLEPADVVFNPSFPWGPVNQKYIRDKNQHIIFLLSNRSSWREMCGYNLDLTTMCQFYSPERCIHENLFKSLPLPSRSPFPARQGIKVLQPNIRKQIIKVLSSGTYANIAYYQFSFPYNFGFLQTKGMSHALKLWIATC